MESADFSTFHVKSVNTSMLSVSGNSMTIVVSNPSDIKMSRALSLMEHNIFLAQYLPNSAFEFLNWNVKIC